jgi:hypothetical protein
MIGRKRQLLEYTVNLADPVADGVFADSAVDQTRLVQRISSCRFEQRAE